MSNPGVIYLTNKELSTGKNFRVEDNIGEAVHVHYDEIRLDFSIVEYLNMVDKLNNAVSELIGIDGFSLVNFDPVFLASISNCLVDLERVEFTTIKLSDIKVQTKGFLGIPIVQPLRHSRVMKALEGKNNEIFNYSQENMIGQTNLERLDSVKELIDNNEYPYDDQYIVLFNNQNNIRDGQHRATCLYKKYGDIIIPVIRLHFNNSKHNVTNYPAFRFLFRWDKKRIRRGIKKILQIAKKGIKKILQIAKRINRK